MDLCHIQHHVYYLPGVVNIGVIAGRDGQAVLIDSGVGDRHAKQLLRALEPLGLTPAAIFNTHGHGDHTGGNAYIVEQTGARIYAPALDSVLLEYPEWATLCLFGGAEPIHELAVPRFAPRRSRPDVLVAEGAYDVAGVTVEALALPGHTGAHTGYCVRGVLFTGDLLSSAEELRDRRIGYSYSVTMRLASLQRLRQLPADYYVLSHDAVYADISDLLAANLAQIEETLDYLRARVAASPVEAHDLVSEYCARFGVSLRHVRDYYMVSPALHAYLSHLHNTGEITCTVQDGRLYWHT